MQTDVLIVGAGPAGIFTAIEMLRHGSTKHIVIVEKGQPVEKRHCPKDKVGHCVSCRPFCHITTGFSGAGAFSDGKFNLGTAYGGTLGEELGEDLANRYINEGLRDRAITRDLEWGIDVPKDNYGNKKIYIWAENVLGYLSAYRVISATGT